MSTVPPVTNTAPGTTSASTASPLPPQSLSQQDFLKLLAAQMSTQDPLNPQTDTAFLGQMAQFSSLQQTQDLVTNTARLQSDQQLLQANALLGRSVQVNNHQDPPTSGIVSAIQIEAGTPKLIVNGQGYSLSDIVAISPAGA